MRTDDEMLRLTRAKAAAILRRRRRVVAGGSAVALVVVAAVAIALPGPRDRSDRVRTTRPAGAETTTAMVATTAEVTSTSAVAPNTQVPLPTATSPTAASPTTSVATTAPGRLPPPSPGLKLKVTPNPTAAPAGTSVAFRVQATDTFADTYKLSIDWGDGSSVVPTADLRCPIIGAPAGPISYDETWSQVYARPGSYHVVFRFFSEIACDPRYDAPGTGENAEVTLTYVVTAA